VSTRQSQRGRQRNRRAQIARGSIWTQPAPGERKPRFTREQIAEVALRIADTEGFDALSMRRIADELGAATMTLYHYVRTKDDLISLMDDTIMSSVLIPEGELAKDWRVALRQIAMGSYRAFMRHPWALDALKGAPFGPNGIRHVEQSLAAVANAPFDQQGKLDALGIVDDYVFGHVVRVVEAAQQKDFVEGKPSKAIIKFAEQMLATGHFPHLEEMLGDGDPVAAWGRMVRFMNDAGRFVRGLDVILDGLEGRFTVPKRSR
jgi:AcrR family transcriptional regulator